MSNLNSFPTSTSNQTDTTTLLLALHSSLDEIKEKNHESDLRRMKESNDLKEFVKESLYEFRNELSLRNITESEKLDKSVTALRQSITNDLNDKFSDIDDKIDKLESKFDALDEDLLGIKMVWRWLKISFATISGIIIAGIGKLLWDWLSRP